MLRFPSSRLLIRLAPVILILPLFLGACGEPPPPRPSALLVTIDTLRADRLGAYGDVEADTSNLDALAVRGVVFDRAYTPAPITLPSHTSLLTGVYPSAHGVRDNAVYRVSDATELVSEVLAERGWRTAAFVGSFVLEPRFGLDQGFEVYSSPSSSDLSRSSANRTERPASEVVDEAVAWLSDLGADEPFFLWVHVNEPHAPYVKGYAGDIADADAQIGRLFAHLRNTGRDEDLLVIAASDHGEALGEHGEENHGLLLHEATMRVPLIVRWPDGRGAGTRSATPVSLVDVAGTILEALGVPRSTLPAAVAPSLAESLQDDGGPPSRTDGRMLYIETLLPYHKYRWHPLRGFVWGDRKFVDTPEPELYALDSDPREDRNLAPADAEAVAAMRASLAQLLADHGPLGWSDESGLSDEDRAALDALGYAGASGGVPVAGGFDGFSGDLPLPRRRIGDLQTEGRAAQIVAVASEQLRQARADGDEAAEQQALEILDRGRRELESWYASYPDNPKAAWDLAQVLMWLGRHAEAVPYLEQHAVAVPSTPRTRYNLALCYQETGRDDWAVAEMRKAVAIDPQADAAYLWLASHYEQAGDAARAAGWLDALDAVWKAPAADRAELTAARAALGDVRPVPAERWTDSDLRPEGLR